ncbi:MAG: hypothetical protein OHK0040_03340 [bacterium]
MSAQNLSVEKNYNAYDITVHWKSSIKDKLISITGRVKNNYVYTIRNLEITARGVDKDGKIICTGNYDFFPEEITPGESKEFSIVFLCKEPIEKITFFYRHYFKGDKDMRDLNFGSFE